MKKTTLFASAALLSSAFFMGCTEISILQDGMYSNRQDYSPQDGYDFYVAVDLTIANNKISKIDVTGDMKSKSIVKYVKAFEEGGVGKKIVGKSLEEAKALGYISGASATSEAFQTALEEIEAEASSS